MSYEQLTAACDEGSKQGLRTVVHAYKDAVRIATEAVCTQIEHGTLPPMTITAHDPKKYLPDPAGLVIENYLLNKEISRHSWIHRGGFSAMERSCPKPLTLYSAHQAPGLKIVFGTDAVAGSTDEMPKSLSIEFVIAALIR